MTEVKKERLNEKKQAASSYIITFYNNVIQLTSDFAIYSNLLLEIESRYAEVDLQKMEEQDKQTLLNTVQNIRYNAQMNYIQYQVMSEEVENIQKPEEKEAIKKQFSKIKDNLIVKRDDLQEYVISLNKFLVKKVMAELLQNSQEYLNDIYNNQNGEPK